MKSEVRSAKSEVRAGPLTVVMTLPVALLLMSGGCASAPASMRVGALTVAEAADVHSLPTVMEPLEERRTAFHRRLQRAEDMVLDFRFTEAAESLNGLADELSALFGDDLDGTDEFRPRVMFWTAFCLQHLGRQERALVTLAELLRDHPEGPWSRHAASLLTAIRGPQ